MLKALDLYSGAGGATRGLQDAGFAVTGVDIVSPASICRRPLHLRRLVVAYR